MKKILFILIAILLNTFIGGMVAQAVGFAPLYGVLGMNAIGVIASYIPVPGGLRAGIYVEAWTGQVVEQFTHAQDGTFLDGVADFSRYAENDVIHLVDCGIDPEVLVNNNTYPLEVQTFKDGDVAVSLDKFETLPTAVSDDELYAISYDKMGNTKKRHGNNLAEKMLDKALHSFAPMSDSAQTPVLLTTGETIDGRLALARKDIIALRRRLDVAGTPKAGRRLVLCNDHVNDLLELDQKFKDQYHNYETGAIAKMYGFEIYEYSACPWFSQEKVKKSYGAIPVEGDHEASVCFYVPRAMKAKGSTKPYISEAKSDPINKRNLMSYTSWWIALMQKRENACGAIVSAVAPEPEPEE
jgi:hypothetical protein